MNHFYTSSYQNDEVECWEKPSGDDPPDITSHGGTAEGKGSRLSSQVSRVLRVLHPAPPGITLITSIFFVNSFVKYFWHCYQIFFLVSTDGLSPTDWGSGASTRGVERPRRSTDWRVESLRAETEGWELSHLIAQLVSSTYLHISSHIYNIKLSSWTGGWEFWRVINWTLKYESIGSSFLCKNYILNS